MIYVDWFRNFNTTGFELIAFVTGTLGVWLTIKENIWCWPFALISVVVSGFVFFIQHLYGDACLQIVYFFAGIYGWIFWQRNRIKEFKVKKTPVTRIPLLVAATLAQTVLYYYLLKYYRGDQPILDALLTAASLTATFMMTKKWVGNWLLWVIIDGTYIVLYAIKHLWFFCALYLVFSGMAYFGWKKWRKQTS